MFINIISLTKKKNLCVTLAKSLLNNHDVEVTFVVDKEWAGKLAKFDERFKFAVIEYDNSQQENRVRDMLTGFKAYLELPLIEMANRMWSMVLEDQTVMDIDLKTGNLKEIFSPKFEC